MASTPVAWLALAVSFAILALLWLATQLRAGTLRAGGSEDPWTTWSASTGSGSNGNDAEDPDRPRVVTIKHLTDRRDKIIRLLRKMGVPKGETEDVAQNVTHSAWRTSPGYDCTRSKLDTWLHKIIFHHAEGFHKSAHTLHSEPADAQEGPWYDLLAEDNPEDEAAAAEALGQALDLLDRIPSHLAVAVVLTDYDGESASSIAEAWGKNKSTVYSWIKQGRAAIARELRRDALLDQVKKRDPEDEPPQ